MYRMIDFEKTMRQMAVTSKLIFGVEASPDRLKRAFSKRGIVCDGDIFDEDTLADIGVELVHEMIGDTLAALLKKDMLSCAVNENGELTYGLSEKGRVALEEHQEE